MGLQQYLLGILLCLALVSSEISAQKFNEISKERNDESEIPCPEEEAEEENIASPHAPSLESKDIILLEDQDQLDSSDNAPRSHVKDLLRTSPVSGVDYSSSPASVAKSDSGEESRSLKQKKHQSQNKESSPLQKGRDSSPAESSVIPLFEFNPRDRPSHEVRNDEDDEREESVGDATTERKTASTFYVASASSITGSSALMRPDYYSVQNNGRPTHFFFDTGHYNHGKPIAQLRSSTPVAHSRQEPSSTEERYEAYHPEEYKSPQLRSGSPSSSVESRNGNSRYHPQQEHKSYLKHGSSGNERQPRFEGRSNLPSDEYPEDEARQPRQSQYTEQADDDRSLEEGDQPGHSGRHYDDDDDHHHNSRPYSEEKNLESGEVPPPPRHMDHNSGHPMKNTPYSQGQPSSSYSSNEESHYGPRSGYSREPPTKKPVRSYSSHPQRGTESDYDTRPIANPRRPPPPPPPTVAAHERNRNTFNEYPNHAAPAPIRGNKPPSKPYATPGLPAGQYSGSPIPVTNEPPPKAEYSPKYAPRENKDHLHQKTFVPSSHPSPQYDERSHLSNKNPKHYSKTKSQPEQYREQQHSYPSNYQTQPPSSHPDYSGLPSHQQNSRYPPSHHQSQANLQSSRPEQKNHHLYDSRGQDHQYSQPNGNSGHAKQAPRQPYEEEHNSSPLHHREQYPPQTNKRLPRPQGRKKEEIPKNSDYYIQQSEPSHQIPESKHRSAGVSESRSQSKEGPYVSHSVSYSESHYGTSSPKSNEQRYPIDSSRPNQDGYSPQQKSPQNLRQQPPPPPPPPHPKGQQEQHYKKFQKSHQPKVAPGQYQKQPHSSDYSMAPHDYEQEEHHDYHKSAPRDQYKHEDQQPYDPIPQDQYSHPQPQQDYDPKVAQDQYSQQQPGQESYSKVTQDQDNRQASYQNAPDDQYYEQQHQQHQQSHHPDSPEGQPLHNMQKSSETPAHRFASYDGKVIIAEPVPGQPGVFVADGRKNKISPKSHVRNPSSVGQTSPASHHQEPPNNNYRPQLKSNGQRNFEPPRQIPGSFDALVNTDASFLNNLPELLQPQRGAEAHDEQPDMYQSNHNNAGPRDSGNNPHQYAHYDQSGPIQHPRYGNQKQQIELVQQHGDGVSTRTYNFYPAQHQNHFGSEPSSSINSQSSKPHHDHPDAYHPHHIKHQAEGTPVQ